MLQKFFFFLSPAKICEKKWKNLPKNTKTSSRIQKIPPRKIMLAHGDRLVSVEALTPT
jgi:hypothetical protein